MGQKFFSQFVRFVIYLTFIAGISSISAQETNHPLSEDVLRMRLKTLEAELAMEHKKLDTDKQSQDDELKKIEMLRHDIANKLLNEKIKLGQLKKRRDVLENEDKGTKTPEMMKAFLANIKSSAERLDIYLREIPTDERRVADIEGFLKRLPEDIDSLKEEQFIQELSILLDILDSIHKDAVNIQVQKVKIRTASGENEEVRMLSVGGVSFAYKTMKGGRVGLALSSPTDASGYRWTETLREPVVEQILQAIERVESRSSSSIVPIPMDVTGRLRVDTLLYEKNLWEQIVAGGPIMFPLAVVAVLALILLIERVWWLYLCNADRTSLIQRAMNECREKRYKESELILDKINGVVPRTLAICVRRRDQGTRAMEDGVQEQLLHELPRLRRFMAGLAILAAVSPLLGLLGTVTGIIRTFGVIYAFGNANPGLMAGGISEALITTAAGLIIAIPIVLCRGVLRGRMEKIIYDAQKYAATLLNMLSQERKNGTY